MRIRLLPESYQQLLRRVKGRTIVPFRPGMTASVDIITERKSGVLSVPLAAVTTRSDSASAKDGTGPGGVRVSTPRGNGTATAVDPNKEEKVQIQEVVFVVKDGKAVLTPVKTGISDFQKIEILSGVPAGATVVSGPFRAVSKKLKDGSIVEIKDLKTLNKEALKEDPEAGK